MAEHSDWLGLKPYKRRGNLLKHEVDKHGVKPDPKILEIIKQDASNTSLNTSTDFKEIKENKTSTQLPMTGCDVDSALGTFLNKVSADNIGSLLVGRKLAVDVRKLIEVLQIHLLLCLPKLGTDAT